jgi:hypothetical protein
MTSQTAEQAARNAVKEEIGDVEDLMFKQKNQLAQKFGVIPAYVTLDEIAYWELSEYEGNLHVRA